MAVKEKQTLDMSQLLLGAYELGDLLNQSAEVADYLYWKEKMKQDEEAQHLIREFAKTKERFEECQRFGHFHPSYHSAMEEMQSMQEKLHHCECIRRYKEAEDHIDELLYDVSSTIAYSVSDSIKVPSNNPLPSDSSCSSCGGNCNGGCG